MRANRESDKILEALDVLNEAAKEKSDELCDMIGDRYTHIKKVLTDKADNGLETVSNIKKQIAKALHEEEEKLLDRARNIDRKVHRNPWPYVGSAVVGALLLGVVLGKK